MAQQLTTFYPFARLPLELRLTVWELTLQPRYLQLFPQCTCRTEPKRWREIVQESNSGRALEMEDKANVTNIWFTSVIEHGSRLPVAVRVHRDSRALILPRYPLLFTKDSALKTINIELEFNDWQWRERTTHLTSDPLQFGASSKIYEYKVRRDPLRPDYIHYNVTPPMMQGARMNVKLDTIILSSQRFMEYHPLALLHSLGDLGPISRIRHIAIDSYVWKCLLANKDWADIITEYRGLKTLYIIGSDAHPLPFPPGRRDKQNSFIEGVQNSLSELGEPWKSTSVGIKGILRFYLAT